MAEFSGAGLICVRGERIVFQDLDFSLEGGGALVLVGRNGSGKSSLLRLLAGLLKPFAGTIAWNGLDVGEEPEAHNGRLHYVGHQDAVKPVLTVAENLRFWAGLGIGRRALDEALETFDIARLAEVPGKFLSAGQKRRVNLARIVAVPAPLWLLDEPITALDAASVAALEAAIAQHRRGGGMVVVSTHADLRIDGAETLDLGHYQAGEALP